MLTFAILLLLEGAPARYRCTESGLLWGCFPLRQRFGLVASGAGPARKVVVSSCAPQCHKNRLLAREQKYRLLP